MNNMFALVCGTEDTILLVKQQHTNPSGSLHIKYNLIETSQIEETTHESLCFSTMHRLKMTFRVSKQTSPNERLE